MASPTARYLLLALLFAVLVTAICAWPAHAWAGRDGLLALGLAALVCLLGAVAGRGIGGLMARLDPSDKASPSATQAAIAVRLLLTLALTLPVFIARPVPMMPFAVWLGTHYLVQLALEVFVSLRELTQNHDPTGTPARESQPEAELPSGSPSGPGTDQPEGAQER